MKTLFRVYFKGGLLAVPFFLWAVRRPQVKGPLKDFENEMDKVFGRHDRWLSNLVIGTVAYFIWPYVFVRLVINVYKKLKSDV